MLDSGELDNGSFGDVPPGESSPENGMSEPRARSANNAKYPEKFSLSKVARQAEMGSFKGLDAILRDWEFDPHSLAVRLVKQPSAAAWPAVGFKSSISQPTCVS